MFLFPEDNDTALDIQEMFGLTVSAVPSGSSWESVKDQQPQRPSRPFGLHFIWQDNDL